MERWICYGSLCNSILNANAIQVSLWRVLSALPIGNRLEINCLVCLEILPSKLPFRSRLSWFTSSRYVTADIVSRACIWSCWTSTFEPVIGEMDHTSMLTECYKFNVTNSSFEYTMKLQTTCISISQNDEITTPNCDLFASLWNLDSYLKCTTPYMRT